MRADGSLTSDRLFPSRPPGKELGAESLFRYLVGEGRRPRAPT